MSIQMNALFDEIYNVPRVPDVVRTLISQINSPMVDIDSIAENVTKEQVISMKVLRLVNSAHFGLSRKISSIEEAVVMLGLAQLKTLVVASGIVSSIPDIEGLDVQTFWSDSFRTATYAKWLAEESGADSETAFTAGLINDLGRILLFMGAPDEAKAIEEKYRSGQPRALVEEQILGYTGQEVAAELCRRWKFPEELVNTVKQSGEPRKYDDASKLSCVVYIAKYLSECRRDNLSSEDILEKFPFDVFSQLEIENEVMQEKLSDLLAQESGLDTLASV